MTHPPRTLCPSKRLQTAIRTGNQVMARFHVAQQTEKTIIRQITYGVDLLGYQFSVAGLAITRQTVGRCAPPMPQLYDLGVQR